MFMIAWTYFYRPFTMGGKVHRAEGFRFDPNHYTKHNIGEGYFAYVLTSPKGKTIVVESTSGAIVGHNLEEVEADICAAALLNQQDVMHKQVEAARTEVVIAISEEEFWRVYEKKV